LGGFLQLRSGPGGATAACPRGEALASGSSRSLCTPSAQWSALIGAPVAVTCYADNSPPPVVSEVAPGLKVLRGEGSYDLPYWRSLLYGRLPYTGTI